jgi:hypothetical protein
VEQVDVHYMVNGLLRVDKVAGEKVTISKDAFCTVIVVEKGSIIKSDLRNSTDMLERFELNYTSVEVTFHRTT